MKAIRVIQGKTLYYRVQNEDIRAQKSKKKTRDQACRNNGKLTSAKNNQSRWKEFTGKATKALEFIVGRGSTGFNGRLPTYMWETTI